MLPVKGARSEVVCKGSSKSLRFAKHNFSVASKNLGENAHHHLDLSSLAQPWCDGNRRKGCLRFRWPSSPFFRKDVSETSPIGDGLGSHTSTGIYGWRSVA